MVGCQLPATIGAQTTRRPRQLDCTKAKTEGGQKPDAQAADSLVSKYLNLASLPRFSKIFPPFFFILTLSDQRWIKNHCW